MFKDSHVHSTISHDGKVYTYYDNESDEDLKIIKSQKSVNEWLKKYIKLK